MPWLDQMLDHCDPTKEIGAAWAVKERLRMLLAEREPSVRRRLAEFYEAAIGANMDETTRLARTIQTWWSAILACAHPRGVQRSHRRIQSGDQADQADRLRLSQHDQLPASYPEPHCGHPTAQISSMNGTNPA